MEIIKMVYNLTNITGANDLYNMMVYTNQSTGHMFFSAMLLILFITFLVVFKKQNFKIVFMAGSFFIMIVSILGFVMGWITMEILIVPIFLFLASVLIHLFIQKE